MVRYGAIKMTGIIIIIIIIIITIITLLLLLLLLQLLLLLLLLLLWWWWFRHQDALHDLSLQHTVVYRAPVPLVASACWVSSNSWRFCTNNYPHRRFNNHFTVLTCWLPVSQPPVNHVYEGVKMMQCQCRRTQCCLVSPPHAQQPSPAPPSSTASHPSGILVSIFVYSARAGSSECSLTFRFNIHDYFAVSSEKLYLWLYI